MKYLQLLIVTLSLCMSNARAAQPAEGLYEQLDDIKALSFVSTQEIAASPEWQPGFGAVPLSVDDAIAAVKEFGKESNAEFAIEKIEIKPVPNHGKHWHYLILIANDAKVTNYDLYIVLMNGKVVPAMIEGRQ